MEIVVKGQYTILGNLDGIAPDFTPRILVSSAIGEVTVSIHPDGKTVEAELETTISNDTTVKLRDGTEFDRLTETVRNELIALNTQVTSAARQVMELVKFALQHLEIDDELISTTGTVWRPASNNGDWRSFPSSMHASLFDVRNTLPLDETTVKALQNYVTDGFEPFVALRHLHRARRDRRPWGRWIDATIAAELAIKEYLLRKEPKLEELLMELPSPPIRTLYGRVLEAYAGWRASRLAQLDKGAGTRNRLLHRPDGTVTAESAAQYVQDVSATLYELLTDLYPNDNIIRRLSGLAVPRRKAHDSDRP